MHSSPPDISTLLSRGQLTEASTLAQQQLQHRPDSARARYHWGLVQLVNQQYAEAARWLQAAIDLDASQARYHCNLGQALSHCGQLDAAHSALQQALLLAPDYATARYNLGCVLLEQGDIESAERCFAGLSQQFPQNADYRCARGDALRQQGQWRRAVRCYQKALDSGVDHHRAESNLGALLVYFGETESALQHCRRAIELAPQHHLGHLNLGRCLLQMEQFEQAMDAFADAYQLNSQSPLLCAEIADVWRLSGDYQEAANWYGKAQQLAPGDARALAGIAHTLLATGNSETALELLSDADLDDPELLKAWADALWDEGDAESALQQLEKLQALQPDHAALHAKAGQIMASAGATEKARLQYLTALAVNPRCIPALHGLAIRDKAKLEPDHLQQIQKLLANSKLGDGSGAALHSALAHYYDGRKDWQNAAEQMQRANELQWQHHSKRDWTYDPDQHEQHIQRLRQVYNADYFARVKSFGLDTLEPVFIIGMPRSGTTLTEQILARHPLALGIGERNFASRSLAALPAYLADGDSTAKPLDLVAQIDPATVAKIANDYLQQLSKLKHKAGQQNVIRVIDKMPDNYSLLGWIVTLFPGAKIIHCKRDPRDVALSCWLTQFGKIQWASRIDDLTRRIQQYQLLMQHWREQLPGRFIEIDYETTVHHQERQSRQLIDWLELDWDAACLSFYESDRLVRTASINQVRQPMYQSSVARWQNYQTFIPELFQRI